MKLDPLPIEIAIPEIPSELPPMEHWIPITIPVEIEFPLVSLPDIQLPLKIKVGEAIFDVNLELKFIERQTVGT
jgi:hypothetical protein